MTRDITNRCYLVISAENADLGTSVRSDCYVHIRRMKNTQADAVTRFTPPPSASDVSLFDLFQYSGHSRVSRQITTMTKITTSVNTSAKLKLKIASKQLRTNASYLLELITSLIFYLLFFFF